MIKYIIFDLAEVLLTGIKATGIALTEKHRLDTNERPSPLMIPLIEEFFHGNISEDEYLNQVIKTYPQLGKKQFLKKHIRENFIEVVGTRDVVLRLKQLGYKLGLLSVHGKEWVEFCDKKFNFHKLFDVISYSYKEKVSKPSQKSFELIIDKFHAHSYQCLFIDDSIANVQAARELGMQAIQFSTASELKVELKRLLPNYL